MAADDNIPVTVFEGGHNDALFLTTLLGGAGINANFIQSFSRLQPDRVAVARRDLTNAIPIVEDFKRRQGIRQV
jgi:hypothetical protein